MSYEASIAMEQIRAEFNRAAAIFPPMRSPHEGLAIVEEEFLEFRQEVFWGDHQKAREEVIQLGAMCLRWLLDCPATSDEQPKLPL